MRVFFAASTSELDKSYDLYKLICNEIVKNGHELTRDWLDEGLENFTQKLSVDYDEMYDDIMASILYADIGVVEGTLRGLSTGHQITIALQRGKPILFLKEKGQDSEQLLMLRGAHSDLIHEFEYENKKEIPKIIKSFFDSQKKGKRIRFNLVLTQKEHQYIDWASYMYNRSKTEIIRELINSRMKSDLNYSRKVPPKKHL
jgi:hypothetical protein